MLSSIKGPSQLSGMRIGLMGGSFNPAHEGHIHISEVALKRLGLDQVWWLVTPQNPHKQAAETANLEFRLNQAHNLVTNPRIKIKNIEQTLGTNFSIETIRALLKRFPATYFCWVMGADNLISFHKWKAWPQIMNSIPVAVIARPGYHLRAGLSKTATRYQTRRLNSAASGGLIMIEPPVWTMILDKLHPLSSTAIRESRNL